MSIVFAMMLNDVMGVLKRHGFNYPNNLSDMEQLIWLDNWLKATKQKQIKLYRDSKPGSGPFYAYINNSGNVEGIAGNQCIYGGAEEVK